MQFFEIRKKIKSLKGNDFVLKHIPSNYKQPYDHKNDENVIINIPPSFWPNRGIYGWGESGIRWGFRVNEESSGTRVRVDYKHNKVGLFLNYVAHNEYGNGKIYNGEDIYKAFREIKNLFLDKFDIPKNAAM